MTLPNQGSQSQDEVPNPPHMAGILGAQLRSFGPFRCADMRAFVGGVVVASALVVVPSGSSDS